MLKEMSNNPINIKPVPAIIEKRYPYFCCVIRPIAERIRQGISQQNSGSGKVFSNARYTSEFSGFFVSTLKKCIQNPTITMQGRI